MKIARPNLIPVVRELPADLETPVSVYLKLSGHGPSFLLESVSAVRLALGLEKIRSHGHDRRSIGHAAGIYRGCGPRRAYVVHLESVRPIAVPPLGRSSQAARAP